MTEMENLQLCGIKLPNYRGDLTFLKRLGALTDLNMSECFSQADFHSISNFPEIETLTKFEFRNVGLISLTQLHAKFPNLEVLDVSENKIFEIETVDEFAHFGSLMVLNFEENPIMVHLKLQQMLQDVLPSLEIFNDKAIKEVGSSF